MNGKITTYLGLLSLSTLMLSSCSQEDPMPNGKMEDDSGIVFITSLPGIETRSDDHIDGESIKKGFYVSAANLDSLEANGRPTIYFKQELVSYTEGMGNAFRSDNCRWPSNKGSKE